MNFEGESKNQKINKLGFDEMNIGYFLTSQRFSIWLKCPVTEWELVPCAL